MKQKDLEMRLQRLEGFREPDPALEQYPTPAGIAADMLYTAHARGDIEGRNVVDLGCGTGVLAIGACLLGAAVVTGLDIDQKAIEVAVMNSAAAGCNIGFVCSDVAAARGSYDTCVMNPPFGSQKRHADVPFLETAAGLADITYSLHNAGTSDFVARKAARMGRTCQTLKTYKLEIRHTFAFHTREKALFDVALVRTVRR